MTKMLTETVTMTGLIMRKQRPRRVLLIAALIYLLLYLMAIGDLRFHGAVEFGVFWSRTPLEVLFKQIAPFYFEAIALVNLPFITYLFSPLNLLFAVALALLVGLNIAFSYLVMAYPKVCYGKPSMGALSSLPGLIAGSTCCGPIILIVLGVQASATVIAVFGWLVPIAVALLLGTLLVNARRTNIDYLRDIR